MRLRALGVPLHPLLVHFPITTWLILPPLDLAALLAGPEPWWTLALGATSLGIILGAGAIVTGLLDYLQPPLAGIDIRLAARHGVRTTLAWCLFTAKMILVALLPQGPLTIVLCLVLDLVGCCLLVQGAYFGTKQVYEQFDRQ